MSLWTFLRTYASDILASATTAYNLSQGVGWREGLKERKEQAVPEIERQLATLKQLSPKNEVASEDKMQVKSEARQEQSVWTLLLLPPFGTRRSAHTFSSQKLWS